MAASPSWSAYSYHTQSALDMTNTPSSDVLVPAGNNVLSIFKAIDPADPLQIKTFDQNGALLYTLNITIASGNTVYDSNFRVCYYNSTAVLIAVGFMFVSPISGGGYQTSYGDSNFCYNVTTYVTDGLVAKKISSAITTIATVSWMMSYAASFSYWGNDSVDFMSNIVNDSNGNYYVAVSINGHEDWQIQYGNFGQYQCYGEGCALFNLLTGTAYNVVNQSNFGSAITTYHGLPTLYYAGQYVDNGTGTMVENGQGTVWIIASGLMVMFNPLSAILTNVNVHTVDYVAWEMNKPMDSWITQISYDGASGLISQCYIGDVFTVNSSSIRFDSAAYYNVSTSVTTTIHRGWSWGVVAGFLAVFGGGFYWDTSPYIPPDTITYTNITASVSYFNNFNETLAGQGLVAVWSTDLSAFRAEFITITSLATYTQYIVDVNGSGETTAGQIISTTPMILNTIEASLTGAYAVRYSNSSTYELLANNGVWFAPPWASTYGLGYFAGSPETVVIAHANSHMTINNYPPIAGGVVILNNYNFTASPIELIFDKPIIVPDAADPMVEVAFAVNYSNLPLNWAIYVSQTNASAISSGNKLVAIDTGILPANFSGWVIKPEYQSGIANHTLAVGFYPSGGSNWSFTFAMAYAQAMPWWAEYGAFDCSYANASNIATQISGMTNLQDAATIANLTGGLGYYLYYSYLGLPSGNGSGYVGGGNYTGFNWTFYWGNMNLTVKNVTTPQTNDSITSLFGQLAAMTGVDVLALGMIAAVVTMVGACLAIAYFDKKRSIPSAVYIVVMLFVIAIYTFVSVLPTYILLTIFALIIAAASIGVASFFSGHLHGGGASSEGGDR